MNESTFFLGSNHINDVFMLLFGRNWGVFQYTGAAHDVILAGKATETVHGHAHVQYSRHTLSTPWNYVHLRPHCEIIMSQVQMESTFIRKTHDDKYRIVTFFRIISFYIVVTTVLQPKVKNDPRVVIFF